VQGPLVTCWAWKRCLQQPYRKDQEEEEKVQQEEEKEDEV
jgi:hypothetical protein